MQINKKITLNKMFKLIINDSSFSRLSDKNINSIITLA